MELDRAKSQRGSPIRPLGKVTEPGWPDSTGSGMFLSSVEMTVPAGPRIGPQPDRIADRLLMVNDRTGSRPGAITDRVHA